MESPFPVVERFDDVAAALRSPEVWRNGDGPGVFFQSSGMLGTTDDPDHARHRRVLRSAFLPSAMSRLEPRVRAIAVELLAAMGPSGSGDFVAAFAKPFPALVIGELLGVPVGDRRSFGALADSLAATLSSGDEAAYAAAKQALGDAIDGYLADRDGSGDDVLSALLRAREDGTLSAAEVRHLGHQLLVAGHETTANLLSTLLLHLLSDPSLRAAVTAEPVSLDAAIEECVRLESPVRGLFRTNATPVGDLVPGTKVQLCFAAANRDPAHWDAPNEFRLDRSEASARSHLGFGWGIHYCLGAPLARLEARVAFEELLAGWGSITLDGEPVRDRSVVLQGLAVLPVRWTSAGEVAAVDREGVAGGER